MLKIFSRGGTIYSYFKDNIPEDHQFIQLCLSYDPNGEREDILWLSKYGYFIPDKNNKVLDNITLMKQMEIWSNVQDINKLKKQWVEVYGEVRYFDE